MLQTLTTASFWLFAFGGAITLCLIVVNTARRYKLATERKGPLILKTVFVLALWLTLSFGVLAAHTVMFISAGHTLGDNPPPPDTGTTLSILALTLAYVAAGAGLVYWAGRRAQVKLR